MIKNYYKQPQLINERGEANKQEKLMNTTEIAKIIGCNNNTITENAKKLFPNKKFENGKATYYNEKEVAILLDKLKNNNNNQSDLSRSLIGAKTTLTNELELSKTLDGIKNLSRDNKLKLGLGALQSLLEDLQKENTEIKQENTELKDWKTEKLYIENEKYKAKELKTKINRLIRKKAIEVFGYSYIDCWNYYYTLYNNIHCFTGKQNLDLVEARGHLKEFYDIIINN